MGTGGRRRWGGRGGGGVRLKPTLLSSAAKVISPSAEFGLGLALLALIAVEPGLESDWTMKIIRSRNISLINFAGNRTEVGSFFLSVTVSRVSDLLHCPDNVSTRLPGSFSVVARSEGQSGEVVRRTSCWQRDP